ncbi:MAG: cation transporter [Bacteroidetes bacterium]|nr:cation transporter [Bacteroidota bacterium]
MILNALIFIIEFIGGILTNSLALISDAMHNLSDFFTLMLSYAASKIVLWKSNSQKSYGYVRVEIFAAFINALTLVIIGAYIIYEGIGRFLNPEPVAGLWMIIIAVVSLIVNTASTLILKKDAHYNLNVKSAYLHLLVDAFESVAVIIIGIFIYWQNWYILDPIISVAIGAFVIISAWSILAETVNILTEGTPKGIDLDAVANFISSFPEVENVHHIHIWGLSSQFRALSAHLVVKDQLISQGRIITKKIEAELQKKFSINHPTLQLESTVCGEQETIVNINHSESKQQ